MNKHLTSGIGKKIFVVIFLLMIWLPFAMMVFGIQVGDLSNENREKAKLPDIPSNIWQLEVFTKEVDQYLDDNFGLRSAFLKANSVKTVIAFGSSPNEKVVIGKEGWLFLDRSGSDKTIDYYKNIDLYDEKDLKAWVEVLESREAWLASQGIEYYFFIGPNKHSIYPEFLPDEIQQVNSQSRADQLYNYVKEHSALNVIDVRPALREEKDDIRVYHRTDTHWNDHGAFIAYQEVSKRISDDITTYIPLSLDDFSLTTDLTEGYGLARMLDLESSLKEESIEYSKNSIAKSEFVEQYKYENEGWIRVFSNENKELPSAVVLGDSFIDAMEPYFSESFSDVNYVSRKLPYFNKELIEGKNPDIVIEEIVERRLLNIDPEDAKILNKIKLAE